MQQTLRYAERTLNRLYVSLSSCCSTLHLTKLLQQQRYPTTARVLDARASYRLLAVPLLQGTYWNLDAGCKIIRRHAILVRRVAVKY